MIDTTKLIEILLEALIPLAFGAIGGIGGSIGWLKFFRKKETRLFKNIRRRIAVVSTDAKPMSHEVALLRKSGLFTDVSEPSSDARSVDYFKGARLIIIGYSKSMANLQQIIDVARTHEIPVLVYAGPREISDEHMDILQGYTYHSMCNTPLRLVSDVFAVMSTTPEEKE